MLFSTVRGGVVLNGSMSLSHSLLSVLKVVMVTVWTGLRQVQARHVVIGPLPAQVIIHGSWENNVCLGVLMYSVLTL